MGITTISNRIRKLIAKGELHSAINDLIRLLSRSPKLDEVIAQSGRLSDLAKEIRLGNVSDESKNITKNQIRNAILELLKEIEDTNTSDNVLNEEIEKIEEFSINTAPFGDWLKSDFGNIYLKVIVGLVLIYGFNLILLIFNIEGHRAIFRLISIVIQLVFIFVVIFSTLKFKKFAFKADSLISDKEFIYAKRLTLYSPFELPPQNEKRLIEYWNRFKELANKVSNQFGYWWLGIWVSWGGLYGMYGLQHIIGVYYMLETSVIENFLSNLNTLFSLFLFLTLTISTSRLSKKFWFNWIFFVVLISGFEYLILKTLPNYEYQIGFWSKLIFGFLGSVSLMIVIGRLTSKFINIPLWIIMLLYIYAAIQALYPFFYYIKFTPTLQLAKDRNYVFTVEMSYSLYFIMFFALILKSLFFLIVTWILKTGRILFFIVEESSLNFSREDNFKDFIDAVKIENSYLE